MKKTICSIWLLTSLLIFAMLSEVRRAHFSGSLGWSMVSYTTAERVILGLVAIMLIVSAIGLAKRKMFTWWLIEITSAVSLCFWLVWLIDWFLAVDLTLQERMAGVFIEIIKVVVVGWLFFWFLATVRRELRKFCYFNSAKRTGFIKGAYGFIYAVGASRVVVEEQAGPMPNPFY